MKRLNVRCHLLASHIALLVDLRYIIDKDAG